MLTPGSYPNLPCWATTPHPRGVTNTEYKMPALVPDQETTLWCASAPDPSLCDQAKSRGRGALPAPHPSCRCIWKRTPPNTSTSQESWSQALLPENPLQGNTFALTFSAWRSCSLSLVCSLSMGILTSPTTLTTTGFSPVHTCFLKFLIIHFSNTTEVLEKYQKPDKRGNKTYVI